MASSIIIEAAITSGVARGRRLRLIAGSSVSFTRAVHADRVDITIAASASGGVSDGDKGDITVSASGATWTIDSGVVTLAKMANMSTDRLLGRDTAGSGVPEEVTVGAALDWLGATQGMILYRGAAGWAALATSTAGYVLQTGGAGANPSWVAPGGISDGDKGDITVSGGGGTWTIDADAVSYSKIQDVSATDKVLGRSTAGAGVIEEIACTAAGRTLIGAASVAAQVAALGQWTTIFKTSDESRASTTTTTADSALTFTVPSGERWAFKAQVFYTTPAAADFKFAFNRTNCNFSRLQRRMIIAGATGWSNGTMNTDTGLSSDVSAAGTGTDGWIEWDGIMEASGGDAVFTFLWAQATTNVGNTTVLKGSYIQVCKVA